MSLEDFNVILKFQTITMGQFWFWNGLFLVYHHLFPSDHTLFLLCVLFCFHGDFMVDLQLTRVSQNRLNN